MKHVFQTIATFLLVLGVFLFAGCPPELILPPEVDSPVINSITVSKDECRPGESIQLSVDVFDPNNDPLTYKWTCTAGEFLSVNGSSCVWRAPNRDGVATIDITVNDSTGSGDVRDSINIKIIPLGDFKNLTVVSDTGGTTVPSGPMGVTYNSPVNVKAVANEGYSFVGWVTSSPDVITVEDLSAPETKVTIASGTGEVRAKFTNVQYSLTITADAHGAVTPLGTNQVYHGGAFAISAFAAEAGYEFVEWQIVEGTGVSFENNKAASTKVTLTSGPATIKAVFRIKSFKVTLSSNVSATFSPGAQTDVVYNSPLNINAIPAGTCYQFNRWEVVSGNGVLIDDPNSASTTVTLLNGDAALRANFVAREFHLTVISDGHGSVTPSNAVTLDCSSVQPISAGSPEVGYSFSKWAVTSGIAGSVVFGNINSPSTTVKLTNGNATIQAQYVLSDYKLTVTSDGHGTVLPSGERGVKHGEIVNIEATPSGPGYVFDRWVTTGGIAPAFGNIFDPTTTVSLTGGNATIQATFTLRTYTLTLTSSAGGTVTPVGNSTLGHGQAATITAEANPGYVFTQWVVSTGSASIANVNAAITTVTLSSGNATVRANFTLRTYTANISASTGGTVTPSGSMSVTHGLGLNITATPSTGYHFVEWVVTGGTGAAFADRLDPSTTVTFTGGNASIQALFAINKYVLTISNDGNGTTTPSGNLTVSHGDLVTIVATPAANYHFTSWSITSGTGVQLGNPAAASTTVGLTAGNATIRANFAINTYTLTVNRNMGGSVTALSTATVTHGQPTAINVSVPAGYLFKNWTTTAGSGVFFVNANAASTSVTLTGGNATILANLNYSVVMKYSSAVHQTPQGNMTVNVGADAVISAGYDELFSVTAPTRTYLKFVRWVVLSGSATITNANSASTTIRVRGTGVQIGLVYSC